MKVTKDSIIGEVITKHPKAAGIMQEFGLHCIYCPVAAGESIAAGAKAHGLNDKKIDEMIRRINAAIKPKSLV